MEVKLSFDERMWLLKCYWKVENVKFSDGGLNLVHHHQIVTITRIRDKFEVNGTAQDVLKGRLR